MLVASPLLSDCLKETLQRAPELLSRCMDDAVTTLKALAGEGREVVVHDSESKVWWVLLQNKTLWGQVYAHLLEDAFAAHERGQLADRALQFHAPSHELEIEDEQAVNEWLEAAQLLQQLQTMVEQDLAALDARLSSLGGQQALHVEKTPLRPSVFVGVLRDLMASFENNPDVRATWLRHITPTLGLELRSLYQHLALKLQRATREQASYRVRLVEAPRSGPLPRRNLLGDESGLIGLPGSASDAQEERKRFKLPTMSALACAKSEVNPEVLHTFLRHGGEPFERALSSAYFERVEQELARLDAPIPPQAGVAGAEQSSGGALGGPIGRHVDTDIRLPEADWGRYADPRERARVVLQAKKRAERVAQVMGIDVVRRLVNQVAQDPLLLAPVREAVVAVEPALVRLAVESPRFFSESEHPARRLVEGVAQRSFQYNDEGSAEFLQFIQPVRALFNRLNLSESGDPKPFAEALGALRTLWAKQGQRFDAVTDQRVRVLRFADERQAMADHFKRELRQRPDLAGVPAFVLEFLERVWSLVVASARLTHPAEGDDPRGYRAAAVKLLWCSREDVLAERPEELPAVLPELLKTLHAGLDSLNMSRTATRPFFESLNRLHEPVLDFQRLVVRRNDEDSAPAPLEGLPRVPLVSDVVKAAPVAKAAQPAPSVPVIPPEEPAKAFKPVRAPKRVPPVSPPTLTEPAASSTPPQTPEIPREVVRADLPPTPVAPSETDALHGFNAAAPDSDFASLSPVSSPVPLPESEEPWLDRSELHTAGFEEPPPTDYGMLVDLPTRVGGASDQAGDADEAAGQATTPAHAMSDEAAEAVLNQIRVGDWIDFCSHGEWLRAQLVWASARATLFMFNSSSGSAHSMSRRSCIKLIRRRWLLPVDTHAVVQTAMQALGSGTSVTPKSGR